VSRTTSTVSLIVVVCVIFSWLIGVKAMYIKSNRRSDRLAGELFKFLQAVPFAAVTSFLLVAIVSRSIQYGVRVGILGATISIVALGILRSLEYLVRRLSKQVSLHLLTWNLDPGQDCDLVDELKSAIPNALWSEVDLHQPPSAPCSSDRVILVTGSRVPNVPASFQVLSAIFGSQSQITTLTELYEDRFEQSPVVLAEGSWLANTAYAPPSRLVRFTKRAVDIILSFVGLLITLPVLILLAILVRADSHGPAFFTQERAGRGGVPFTMYKLRSMTEHKDDSATWPSVTDHTAKAHHVTQVGRLLRRTGLDEIPQLANVLKGDMSIVGPRPRRIAVLENTGAVMPHFASQMSFRPGITGWASLHSGEDVDMQSLKEKMQYNLFYVQNHSVLFDLTICAITVAALARGKKPASMFKNLAES